MQDSWFIIQGSLLFLPHLLMLYAGMLYTMNTGKWGKYYSMLHWNKYVKIFSFLPLPGNGHASNLSNGLVSKTSKQESHPETTMSSIQRAADFPKGIKVKQTNKYWMFLICINFIPRTESQAFRTHSFSLFYSLLPPLFWKISPLHSWFFFLICVPIWNSATLKCV